MQKLKLDNYVKRAPDRKAREIPKRPLTEAEKLKLADMNGPVWKKCLKAYVNRMRASALLSDFETEQDLVGEAYIAMWNILNKFDLAECGEVAKYDVEGKTNPKTLEFYFVNYFYHRVNFIACEARAAKKQRGVGPAESLDEVSYDPEDEKSDFSEHFYKYNITGEILSELKAKDPIFRRFFVQLYRFRETQRDLRVEYGDRFNILKAQAQDFIIYLKNKHGI